MNRCAADFSEKRRYEFQAILEEILGSENVYFQPPESFKMCYPCIRYERSRARTLFADNRPYRYKKCYSVTFIGKDPDSDVPDKLAQLPLCLFDRHYKADNLNHDVFTIYY